MQYRSVVKKKYRRILQLTIAAMGFATVLTIGSLSAQEPVAPERRTGFIS